MKIILNTLILSLAFFIVASCSSSSKVVEKSPEIKTFKNWKAHKFNKKIELNVGWYEYQNEELVKVDKNVWEVKEKENNEEVGAIPAIIIKHPETGDSLWVNMDIDEALLGTILKHSLMTEVQIKRPFSEFFKQAQCTKCHPSHINLPENEWRK